MSGSLKAGIICPLCETDPANILSTLDGKLLCLDCRETFAIDPDKELPEIVVKLLQAFVQDCCFKNNGGWVFDNKMQGERSLKSCIDERNTCKIEWRLVSADAPRNRDETDFYEPGKMGAIPAEILNLLRDARDKGLRCTEMPKSDQGKYRYARLEGYFLYNPAKVLEGFFTGNVFSILVQVRIQVNWVNPSYVEESSQPR